MKIAWPAVMLIIGVVPAVTILPAFGQQPADAESVAVAGEVGPTTQELTVFDRDGNVVSTVGGPGTFRDPVFSPDGDRLAVVRLDPDSETADIWTFDVATGTGTRITSAANFQQEGIGTPVWSPDGSQLVYVALRGGYEGLYRTASQGEEEEELLYQYPGAGMRLRDWSMDGRFVIFSSTDLSGGRVYALRMDGSGDSAPVEILSSQYQLRGSSVSPDGRFLSYTSDRSGRNEVYVRPIDLDEGVAEPAAQPSQVSVRGGDTIASAWRSDGSEIYYVAADGAVMAVRVATGSTFTSEAPTLLFRLSEAVEVESATANVSRDGERIVVAVPRAPTLQQITIFDRQGMVVTQVGEPGRFRNPSFSPDGTTVAVHRIVPDTGNREIWTYDVDSGEGMSVTSDRYWQETPLWSPDGDYLAYASVHGLFDGIYRKASDGTGDEVLWFEYTPGADLELTDWSADGRFIAFHDTCWGVVYVLAVNGEQASERAVEWLRDEYHVAQPRFSPDCRFIAYLSDEIEPDVFQVYVAPFDSDEPDSRDGIAMPVQVSAGSVRGMVSWRQDGQEIYYMTPDWEVMAVEVSTTPMFQVGTSRHLFTLPGRLSGSPVVGANVSRDGQRFVFAVDVPVSAY
jgi:Tol biopolymer transport system component